MERYIKYKRISKVFILSDNDHQEDFFDDLIFEGWEIIFYNEKETNGDGGIPELEITVVVGRKQKIDL